MGEKFSANPVTGTGSLSVPIYTSPGRSGIGPQLSLSYDSGAGNGPFGFGWSLSIPAITRKTDKGLPRYRDDEESDVFVLSGAEDLVPALKEVEGQWEHDAVPGRIGADAYLVHRYRPRVEGLFARIERWVRRRDGDAHWRSISRDNVTTLYGTTAASRIADPADTSRVFSWLICETYDGNGNAIRYDYRAENSQGLDPSLVSERNRTDATRAANRYLKRIRYGNRTPRQPGEDLSLRSDWMFEVVFDYGEHYTENAQGQPTAVFIDDNRLQWGVRRDPFSSYRAGFEVRTYRLCRRVLVFHHFPDELGAPDLLVRSTQFTYDEDPIASFITTVTQSGYVRRADGTYLKKSLPPLEFEYSRATVADEVREIDAGSLENLPSGLDGARYQWIDLDGEGASGILTEQAGAWFYKRNLSPACVERRNGRETSIARFAPAELVAQKPSLADANGGHQRFLDLAGDGQLDLVQFAGPVPGFYERTDDAVGWEPFTPFTCLPELDWNDPHLRFIDLSGDGYADILLTEDEVFTWYPSLAEEGFGPGEKVRQSPDEERGPKLLLTDVTQSVYLADISGDGLTDLVRIRNGEVCYWPNLGYGRFGARVTMDHAPQFDAPDQFQARRILLADIDGTGVTDVIYLHRDGVRLYFNQSGNGWSGAHTLTFPHADNLSAVTVVDLLGTGTACIVWSSPLPGDARRSMRYLDLMGSQKPHLLVGVKNSMGAETRVRYAPSTKFYLEDRAAGRPWITKLPFPVHVVERVETHDRISRNRFVVRYAYHHGYFDGKEREFRGFGMVEQWDTEEFAALSADDAFPDATNIDEASHVPPVLTRTWFHTGAYLDGHLISRHFEEDYYREPGLTDQQHRDMLLADTVLPVGLSAEEEREACRALKGAILRQETYALDASPRSEHPYSVSERSYTIKRLQPQASNRHAVFFVHARETISYHYERNPGDPRVGHELTLAVDDFGNVTRSAVIGYPRRPPAAGVPEHSPEQRQLLVTCTESDFTNAVTTPDAHHAPLPHETRTYELTGATARGARFAFEEMLQTVERASPLTYEETATTGVQKRLIERVRHRYYRDDLREVLSLSAEELESRALPFGRIETRPLPYETYRLAFTPGLIARLYGRDRVDAALLREGGYVFTDGGWWIPSGRQVPDPDRFYLPARSIDPFGRVSSATYDRHALLLTQTRDPLGNVVSAENDYRTMSPRQVTDPNGNRSQVAFDALGMVVGTAVMGKAGENRGDSLAGFEPDLDDATASAHIQNPLDNPHGILGRASTRVVYDLGQYRRTSRTANPLPNVVYTLARETHDADPAPAGLIRIQHSFSYSDGFGREIQKKIQAEPGPLAEGGSDVAVRWVGSGWTIFNNKGKPVKRYEPFFSSTHQFELRISGTSSTLFYDPLERVVATLHPNHTYEKVVFDPWQQTTWDVNDTVLRADPKSDPHVGDFFRRLDNSDYLPTWHESRRSGQRGSSEQAAALKAAAHADTPATVRFDTLGRPFLTIADNGSAPDGTRRLYRTGAVLDIEGNQRALIDARHTDAWHTAAEVRLMEQDFDMLGRSLHTKSADAGERWMLPDVAGNPVRSWDGRGHTTRTTYDALRRPTRRYVRKAPGVEPDADGVERLRERTVYGEAHPDAAARNLRGRAYRLYDGAGVLTSEAYDFKGNLLGSSRRVVREYRRQADWSSLDGLEEVRAIEERAGPLLEAEEFGTTTAYDALNRPTGTTNRHDGSEVLPAYNEAGLLERVDVRLRGAQRATPLVTDLDYDARGQRALISYGNGVRTTYDYDPLTFRLRRLLTARASSTMQDLTYTYDPVGNITEIRDASQQTISRSNERVEPVSRYEYDPLYRLIRAEGREHAGQTNYQPTAARDNYRDYPFLPRADASDHRAVRNYAERYEYDPVGNILSMVHTASGGAWTRRYAYAEEGNRLLATSLPRDDERTFSARYAYDAHGNMTGLPHLPTIRWNDGDEMHSAGLGGGGTAYYIYDAGGQRVRKVIERQNGTRQEERVYLGGYEIFREYDGRGLERRLERETLHIMDDRRRVAIVETKTRDDGRRISNPAPRVRYQLDNHLGSACLELDQGGERISYEEYHPYGTTSYQMTRSEAQVSVRRYRYTGKERDEETGLYYHGARYYAPWLGRWIRCDPAGMVDGPNLYQYVSANPVKLHDPAGTQETPARIPGENVFQRDTEWHPALSAPLRREITGVQLPGQLRYSIRPQFQGNEMTMRTVFLSPQWAYRAALGARIGVELSGADVITQFDVPRRRLLGTGSTLASAYVAPQFRWRGTGRPVAGTLVGEHFQTFRQRTGLLPVAYSIDITNESTVRNLRAGRPFSTTTIGRMTAVAARRVGLELSSAVRVRIRSTSAHVMGRFVMRPSAGQLARAVIAGTIRTVMTNPRAQMTVAAGTTAALYGRAAVSMAVRMIPGVVEASEAAGIVRAVGARSAVSLATRAVTSAAPTVVMAAAAAFAVYWAVEDTRRSTRGQTTMSEEAVQTWGHYGFLGTLREFGRELRDAPSVLGWTR